MFNQITLIGNLGNNAEVQAEGRLLKLSVATSSNYKNKSGEWVNDTEWHNVKLWNDKANEMATRFLKGSRVLVVGSIATSLIRRVQTSSYSYYSLKGSRDEE